jgi:hypothetical protein
VLAFVTNRSFIESRTFDGFRKTVAKEFADIYVVDLGGDVRANPKLSGTKHNVFGIQTGVAISFMVKKVSGTKEKRLARVHYVRRPELETAEEKLSFLASHPMRALDFDEVQPDKTHNWVNLTSNDFETLMPLASKETKAAKTAGKERAIFKLFSLGVVTNRDEWVYDERDEALHAKVNFLVETYNGDVSSHQASANAANPHADFGTAIKWTRAVKADLNKGLRYTFDDTATIEACYRPFVKRRLYFHPKLNEMQYQLPSIFGRGEVRNPSIVISDATAQKPWMVCAVEQVPDLHFVGAAAGTVCMPVQRLAPDGGRADNITDWALKQFTAHYKEATATGAVKASASKARKITKEAIFHYCYAVLHDPVYREKVRPEPQARIPAHPALRHVAGRLLAMGRLGGGLDGAAHRLRGRRAVPARAHRHPRRQSPRRRPAAQSPPARRPGRQLHHAGQRNHSARRPDRSLDLQTRQPLRAGLGARPVQGKETQGPHHPREVRHLPLCRPQGKSRRPAGPRDHGERGNSAHRGSDEGRGALTPTGAVEGALRLISREKWPHPSVEWSYSAMNSEVVSVVFRRRSRLKCT